MFSKGKTIVLELEKHYNSQDELCQAVMEGLKKKDKECQQVDCYTVLVDNKPYELWERTTPIHGYLLHEAVLKAMESS